MSNEQEGKGRHNASPDEETDLRWWMICYASTSEGYFTNDLWIDIIAKFIDLISPVKGDLSVFSTLYLPAHSSHIIQPLDDVPFALKRIGCQTRDKLTLGRQIRRESLDNVTQEAILIAEKKTFTTYIIKAGFARTGVWPWYEKLIRQNFARNKSGIMKTNLPLARGTVFKKLGMCMTGDEV
jgi:hypothetical protein